MRRMYDSITAADIPADAQMVAGYVNGTYRWSPGDWARFPNAVKVHIATQANVNDGHVLDVEQGDATPGQAPGWVAMRRAAGVDPTAYCNASTWPLVRAAFQNAGIPEPHYWIAKYDNVASVPAGAVAKQYIDPPAAGGHYDLSAVLDYWPGVDSAPTPIALSEEDMSVNLVAKFDASGAPVKYYDVIPVNGKKGLFLASAYGHKVAITGVTAVFNTNSTPQTSSVTGVMNLDPDRPGPIALPDNVRHVVVEYIADHDFRGWAA